MQTIPQAAVQAAPVSRVSRLRGRIAAVVVTLAFAIGGSASSAFAVVTDPTAGAGDTFFTTLSGYLTTYLIPAVLTLTVIGVAVSMLLKWGKRAAKSS